MSSSVYSTQNDLLLKNLKSFYLSSENDGIMVPNENLHKMLKIITGES